MSLDQSMRILSAIWGNTEGYVALPRKVHGQWSEQNFLWPKESDKVKQWIEDGDRTPECNQYFCPNLFSENRRDINVVIKPQTLYADLDVIRPENIPDELKPSIAIESSPNSFQGIWLLKEPVSPQEHESVNQRLTYFLGADKSGWDLTQVLRVPNMRNYKYPDAPRGRVIWARKLTHDFSLFNTKLPVVEIMKASKELDKVEDDESENILAIMNKYPNLPAKLRQDLLISYDKIMGDRSSKLWELEVQLLESGVTRDDVYRIIKRSAWNKYVGRRDEEERLLTEIDKAIDYVGVKPRTEDKFIDPQDARRLMRYSDLMGNTFLPPSWLIEGFWTVGGHGMIAGEPKTYKSTIVAEMAFSIASGKPLFDVFPVHNTGPVLIVQEENSPGLMQDRFQKLSVARGTAGKAEFTYPNQISFDPPVDLPIYFVNNPGIQLDNPTDQEYISTTIEDIEREAGEPVKLVVFDPLYLMLGSIDENSSKELRNTLNWLLHLRYKYGCAIMIVHHWNKSGSSKRGGQRMLGSVTLHGWVSSAIYTRVEDEETHSIIVEREFREFENPGKLGVKFNIGNIGEMRYGVEVQAGDSSKTPDMILQLLEENDDGLTEKQICEMTEMGRTAVRARINELADKGLIEKVKSNNERSFLWRAK